MSATATTTLRAVVAPLYLGACGGRSGARGLVARALCLVLAMTLPVAPTLAHTQTASVRTAVKGGLRPPIVFDGQGETWTLAQRMARWKTPGVSIVVIHDSRIVFARGYGIVRAGRPEPVTVRTRFPAASVSKPIAAVVALSLVEQGSLSLEGDVNGVLRSWRLPASDFTNGRPVTLRDLLSHTAGTTVDGFDGYPVGGPVPTLLQVLNGAPPANSPPVVLEARPGERWKYSGGGYEIVQQMIEDATSRPFAEMAQARVLDPACMSDSGYATPPDGYPVRTIFAQGHDQEGQPIAGGWRAYPEQAAAGLWTTPSDLARFGLALTAAWRGGQGGLLKPATMRAMFTPVAGDYGLGVFVHGAGQSLTISHSGVHEGFRVLWLMRPASGEGIVVMTNADGGDHLAAEIVRAVAHVYGWTDLEPRHRVSFPLPANVLVAREGVWVASESGAEIAYTVRRKGGGLLIGRRPSTATMFTAVSAAEMLSAESGAHASFETGADGNAMLKVDGLELRKR